MNLNLLLSYSLSHHQYVTQMLRSGYWTRGYLSHMSQEVSLEKLDRSVVIMGNDVACQMIGIGTVRIKMFDGV